MDVIYKLNGKVVPRRKFLSGKSRLREIMEHHSPPGTRSPGGWPVHSDALAIHPSQEAEYRKYDESQGVPTDYDRLGRPILRSRKHRREYFRAHMAFDKDAGYGDAAPRNS